jgi:hypothetical protein
MTETNAANTSITKTPSNTAAGMLGINRVRYDWNHPRRCQAHYKATGERCRYWAMRDCKFCKKHNNLSKYHKTKSIAGNTSAGATVRTAEDMAKLKFYSKRLGPKLTAALEEMVSQPLQDQLSLFEELAIVREVAGQALELYSVAQEKIPATAPNRAEVLASAGMLLQSALENVRTMCKTAAEVNAAGKDKYSIHSLQDVAAQIVRMVTTCFGDRPEQLAEFDAMLTQQLRLPKAQADGTTLTPDMDALDMDATIPAWVGPADEVDAGQGYDEPTTEQ